MHPHFEPLTPMLEALCNEVFLVVKHNEDDETPMRMPTVASGDYDHVLNILKTILKGLPTHDSPLLPPPFGGVHHDATLMLPPLGLFKMTSAGSWHKGNWGSDSGYGGGETSQSSSHRGRRMVSSTGDMDGVKKRRNNSSPNKTTTTRRTTSLSTKGVTRSATKRSNDQHVVESTSSSSSKRRKAGQV